MSPATSPTTNNQTAAEPAAGGAQVESFLADLERQGKSPHTVRNYRADLQAFQCWFDGANHEEFDARFITPLDVLG